MNTANTTVKLVVGGLLAIALISLVGIIGLAATHGTIPDVLQNTTVGAMAALAGILAKTGTEPAAAAVQVARAEQVGPNE